MALLDLCAFAFTQVPADSRLEARQNYEFAYKWAVRNSLPNLDSYRDVLDRYSK
jgi:hypothetical protein